MKFVNVIGQQEVKDKLLKSVADDRISHAQLFLATEGAGALAMALAYSQYINCTNRNATDSCGTCRVSTAPNLSIPMCISFILFQTVKK